MKKILFILGLALCGFSLTLMGQMNEKRVLSETSHQIYDASYSPDGKFIATTGSDNNIILWNSETGIIYRTLGGLKKRPNRVVFSKDGTTIYSAGEDGLITTWDPLLAKKPGAAAGHTGAIKALDINPGGTLLASGGEDKTVRIWGIAGDKLNLVYELKGHKKSITSLAFSPDGQTLVSGGADRMLIQWDTRNGTNIQLVDEAHRGVIRCVSFSPDGRFLATGGDDNLIRVWNGADLTSVKTLEGHTDWVQTLDYSGSGDYLFSGGHDKTIRVWDIHTGKEAGHSNPLEHIVLSVDVHPVRNDFISSCLLSEDLRIWGHGYGTATAPSTVRPAVNLQDQVNIPTTEHTGTTIGTPSILLFSPEPINGEVVHGRSSILLIGKADDPAGIQTMLVNRQRVEITESGIFQVDLALSSGDNQVDLVAVSNKGKMARTSFVIHCTDENASRTVVNQPAVNRGNYHALIIAVNEYADEKINDLDYPIADADSLYRILINNYSFSEEHVTFLKNPNRTQIIIAMDELSRSVTTEDNLLIFYAGHGYWDDKTGIGYWLPGDADRNNTANWFRNSTLRDFIGSIQSRHTLLIADACFSGSIFKTRSAFSNDATGIQKLHELPSRKAMTSGLLKEVPDKSVFVKYLLRELRNNEAEFLPSEELFSSFKTAVLNNSPNVPQYGTIQNVGDEGGDFVFVKK